MAKQRKTLPARRKNAIDTSLLIRSAESLGRVIGSLQRQLDAARQLTARSTGTEPGRNGHTPVRKRSTSAKAKSRTPAKAKGRTATKSSRNK